MLGLVGKKIGMSRLYDENGVSIPVTLVQMYECCISDYVNDDSKDFALVTVAFDIPKKINKVAKPQRVAFEKKGLSPYRKMHKKTKEQKSNVVILNDYNIISEKKDSDEIDKIFIFTGSEK